MSPALIALTTAAAILGLLLLVIGFLPAPQREEERMPSRLQMQLRLWRSQFTRGRQLIALGGVIVGIILFAVSGWVVLLIAAPVAAVGVPLLLGKGTEGQTIARLEALETWTRSLAGLTIAGAGLEQTIAASLDSAPEAIRPQVKSLVARINARWQTRVALQQFANELDDATADLVVAHLLLAERMRGAGLANALEDLAEIIFEEVRVRRQIETDRSKPRSNVRTITIVTLLVLALIPFTGEFMAPYRTPLGQILLTVWLLFYAVLLLWLKRITLGKPAPRILVNLRDRKGTR